MRSLLILLLLSSSLLGYAQQFALSSDSVYVEAPADQFVLRARLDLENLVDSSYRILLSELTSNREANGWERSLFNGRITYEPSLDTISLQLDALDSAYVVWEYYPNANSACIREAYVLSSPDGQVIHDTVHVEACAVSTVSIVEPLPALRIYPNPAMATVIVQVAPERMGSAFALYDLQGHQWSTGHLLSNDQCMDVSSLPDGMYWLHIQGVKPIKFVVQKTLE